MVTATMIIRERLAQDHDPLSKFLREALLTVLFENEHCEALELLNYLNLFECCKFC